MGTNSTRSRSRCKHDCCNELTRSSSGLCRLHMLTPAEAVIVRRERPLSADCGRWPLVWQGGVVQRDRLRQTSTMPVEASQDAAPPLSTSEVVCVAPEWQSKRPAGMGELIVHSAATPQGYTLEEMAIFAVGIVGLAAVAAWTLHNHGLI